MLIRAEGKRHRVINSVGGELIAQRCTMSKAITRSKGEGDLRELVDRLETENRMLRTHNIYLKTQLNNSRSELGTLRLLFRELNELGLGALLQVLEGFQFPQETQPRDWNADAVVYPQAIFPTEVVS